MPAPLQAAGDRQWQMAVVTNHRSDGSCRHDHGEVAWPELHGCGNRKVTRTAKVYWCRRASVSNPISGELAHPADYRLIGYSGRHWRRFLCTRADPFWEPLLWHTFHPRLVGRTRARTLRTKWLRDGTHVHVLLAFCRPCRRELFRPTPALQPSRHASSAASCEGRAERGWLPLRACRERSGRQTALPPSQHAPSNNFPSPISCATDRGRRRAGSHPPLRIGCGPARATPCLLSRRGCVELPPWCSVPMRARWLLSECAVASCFCEAVQALWWTVP